MNEQMVELWNSTVSSNDSVYVIGDFSMQTGWAAKYAKRLQGRKILISGNHDKCWAGSERWVQFYKEECGFIEVFPRGNHPLITLRWDNGIDFTPLLVKMSHMPYNTEDPRFKGFIPTPENEDFLLTGHVHDRWKEKAFNGNYMLNVGVDQHDFKPISEEMVIDFYINRNNKKSSEACS